MPGSGRDNFESTEGQGTAGDTEEDRVSSVSPAVLCPSVSPRFYGSYRIHKKIWHAEEAEEAENCLRNPCFSLLPLLPLRENLQLGITRVFPDSVSKEEVG